MSQDTISLDTKNRNFTDFRNTLGSNWNERGLVNTAKRLDIRIADAWAIALEEYNDKEVFKKLEWKIRTWDNWAFNACDSRFGEDWPGRIPAQLVAHTLYFFTNSGDIVIDPMAGVGVVSKHHLP